MLTIAVIGDYPAVKTFVERKYRDRIKEVNHMQNVYTLQNGDVLMLCYGEPFRFMSVDFDALVVIPSYSTVEDIIRYRCSRER